MLTSMVPFIAAIIITAALGFAIGSSGELDNEAEMFVRESENGARYER